MKQQDIAYWNSKDSVERYTTAVSLFDAERVMLFDALERLSRPAAKIKILDVGCGGGRTTKVLLNLGFDVVGIDIAENLIESLQKEIGKKRALIADAADLPFSKSNFDIVLFSHNGLDYLYPYKNRVKSLREVNRVLKPKGYFIFSSHVFQPIPFNAFTSRTVFVNFLKIQRLLRSGYYKEFINNSPVYTYSVSSIKELTRELNENKFELLRRNSYISVNEKNFLTFLKAQLSWERYYLAQKK